MRIVFALPLLMVAACGVENDPQNDQVTLEYDEERIENTAADVGNTAEEVAEDVGNTVENIDIDVDTDGGDASADETAADAPAEESANAN